MNILIACEESQIECIEFRKRGHLAFSCDIKECSGGHPEWHINYNVLPLLDGNVGFCTQDCKFHYRKGGWDLIIAHPPCTDLASSGARWFKQKRENGSQENSINFFMNFVYARCDKIAIENPIGIMSTLYRKPDQIIQPWMFGHGETKSTCLWLKGLPKLKATDIVDGREQRIWKMSPGPNRSELRSKSYIGIAKAMADQWG